METSDLDPTLQEFSQRAEEAERAAEELRQRVEMLTRELAVQRKGEVCATCAAGQSTSCFPRAAQDQIRSLREKLTTAETRARAHEHTLFAKAERDREDEATAAQKLVLAEAEAAKFKNYAAMLEKAVDDLSMKSTRRMVEGWHAEAVAKEDAKLVERLSRELMFAQDDLRKWKMLYNEMEGAVSKVGNEGEVALIHKREAEYAAASLRRRVIALTTGLTDLGSAACEFRAAEILKSSKPTDAVPAFIEAAALLDAAIQQRDRLLADPEWQTPMRP